jgi:hypothetical protein
VRGSGGRGVFRQTKCSRVTLRRWLQLFHHRCSRRASCRSSGSVVAPAWRGDPSRSVWPSVAPKLQVSPFHTEKNTASAPPLAGVGNTLRILVGHGELAGRPNRHCGAAVARIAYAQLRHHTVVVHLAPGELDIEGRRRRILAGALGAVRILVVSAGEQQAARDHNQHGRPPGQGPHQNVIACLSVQVPTSHAVESGGQAISVHAQFSVSGTHSE